MPQRASRQEVTKEWKRRRIREVVIFIPSMVSLIVLTWISSTLKPSVEGISSSSLATIAFAAISICFVLAWLNWRCPGCNRNPGLFDPKFCSQCGVQLH